MTKSEENSSLPPPERNSNVWVIHGRNKRLNDGMVAFLESLGLTPRLFLDARETTKERIHYIGDTLAAGLTQAAAVVVLLTPDDSAKLRPVFCSPSDAPYERRYSNQPRMNVIFEAGMAMMTHRGHTILVQFGWVKPFSDLGGHFIVQMDGSIEKRAELKRLLEDAGCPVMSESEAWKTAGDLNPNPKISIRPLHGREIKNFKEFDDILNHSGNVIDEQAYGSYRHYAESRIPRGLSLTWIGSDPKTGGDPDIYTFLIDPKTQKPAGYINAMPLEEKWYNRVRAGELRDNQIQAEAIAPFADNGHLKIYIMSIAIDWEYRQLGDGLFQRGYVRLINAFLDKLIFYAKTRKVRVTHFLAIAWSVEGHHLCKSFGMVPVGADRDGDVIYELDLSTKTTLSNMRVLPRLKQLFALYRKMI